MKVLVAGELNADLVLQGYSSFPALGMEVLVEDASLTLGSASAICASALARLGNEVSLIGKAGEDAWGDLCIRSLADAGVDCSLIQRDAALKTGITVSLSSAQDRALVTYLGAITALRAQDIRDETLAQFAHLHVSSFFLQRGLRPGLKGVLARAHAQGLTTSLDPGFDPENEWESDLMDVLSEIDIFLPNEVELASLTREQELGTALGMLKNGRTLTVAKLGKNGCAALENGCVLAIPAFPVKPVDTTGAGDTFNAGFLHAWKRGESIPEAMRFGAACGAVSTLAAGGTSRQPSVKEAHDFMAQYAEAQIGSAEVTS